MRRLPRHRGPDGHVHRCGGRRGSGCDQRRDCGAEEGAASDGAAGDCVPGRYRRRQGRRLPPRGRRSRTARRTGSSSTVLNTAVSAAREAVGALDRMSTRRGRFSGAGEDRGGRGCGCGRNEADGRRRGRRRARRSWPPGRRWRGSRWRRRFTLRRLRWAGLTVASSDADVAAAQAAIDAADAALRTVRLLSASDALAFRDSIDAARAALETVEDADRGQQDARQAAQGGQRCGRRGQQDSGHRPFRRLHRERMPTTRPRRSRPRRTRFLRGRR